MALRMFNLKMMKMVMIEMKYRNHKDFANGSVYVFALSDGMLIETTDTFLPYYTKNCINGSNKLNDGNLGSRNERWMIGVSVMSGCPVRCKFCATGQMKKYRNLTALEIVEQVEWVVSKNGIDPRDSKEFKINYTRMGEPFLNIEAVKEAIRIISSKYPNAHHYISTIGVEGSDFSFIEGKITLQVSVHALDNERRNELIPYNRKMKLEDLGKIWTASNLKTTVNLTLVKESDFDLEVLKRLFDPRYFFIKLSPINVNCISEKNELGSGVIVADNLI